MRKPLRLSAAIVLLAAGFAVASIATGGSLAAVEHAWTNMTGTNATVTTSTVTTGTTGGRGVEICEHFNRGHRRFGVRTMVVAVHELHFRLGHGSRLGPCPFLRRHHHHHGFGNDPQASTTTTTTAVTTTSGPTGGSGFVGRGTTSRGQDGDDDGDDNGGNAGNGGTSNLFAPNFGHGHSGHRH